MKPREFFDRLKAEEVPGVIEIIEGPADSSIVVEAERLAEVVEFLRDDPECLLDQLSLVSGTQYDDRFECVYHLLSVVLKHSIVIKVRLDADNPSAPSLAGIHPAADWHERETYDLVGIRFEGHPNLKRIYLPEGWEGHPLRRDYEFPAEFEGVPFTDLKHPPKKEDAAAEAGTGTDTGTETETEKDKDK